MQIGLGIRTPVILVLVSKYSIEVEYRVVAIVVSETCWIHNFLLELHCPIPTVTLIYCDNVSTVYLSGNLVHHQHTKHIEMDIHFVRDIKVPIFYQGSPSRSANLPIRLQGVIE